MLDSNIQTQLRSYFEKIQHPVELVATLDASPKSIEMLELLRELIQLTDKISLKENSAWLKICPLFAAEVPPTNEPNS